MREILFRGKLKHDTEWVEGYYMALGGKYHYILTGQPDITKGYPDLIKNSVDPETVGQYTGLLDKDGRKIFEGDIIEGHRHSARKRELIRCEVAYGRYGFEARHYVNCGGEWRYYTYKVLFSKDVVVIGNIHDNPELLEA